MSLNDVLFNRRESRSKCPHSYEIGARAECNLNFGEGCGSSGEIMRGFPYAEIFLLYLAVRLLSPPLVCQTIRRSKDLVPYLKWAVLDLNQ